jgi:hypothetical protein
MATPEQIEAHFQQLDWPFSRKEDNLWESGYSGSNVRFRYFVRLTPNWLYVTYLFPVAIRPECRAAMYEHCLRMCFTMNAAKVMLDDDDDLTITVEYPAENLDVARFESAMRNVCWAVDRFFVELVNVATNPAAVSSLGPASASKRFTTLPLDAKTWGERHTDN